ncbi:MAG: glycosyltransferase [Chloroflexota bacterium]
MRIAILSVHSCPTGNLGARDTGGMSVYIRELARELGSQGHRADIYTQAHDHGNRVTSLGEGVRLVHLEAGGRSIPKQELYPSLPEFAANLEDFCQGHHLRYDLIFSHYWLSGWVGQELGRRWHVPHMVMFHTLGAVKNALGLGEEEPPVRLATEGELAQNCQRLIASTLREKDFLTWYYRASPENIGVVPCGVNLARFRPYNREESRSKLGWGKEKVLLFVGRIEPLKGLERLITALSLLEGECPRLVVLGGDQSNQPEVDRLQELARRLQVQEHIIFSGRVEHDELPYFYSAADASVIPSYYESFCLVALESLACGTPVLATDVGDLKNIIWEGETGYVVKDNSPHLLAGKIPALLRQGENFHRSTDLIRRSVAPFGWANIAREIAREAQKTLGDHRASGEEYECTSICSGHKPPSR